MKAPTSSDAADLNGPARATDGANGEGERFLRGLHVNRGSTMPIQAQLYAQIQYAIATGALRERAPLPTINELAAALGINRNTVQLVYGRLRAAGFLDVEHGRGVFVSAASTAPVVNDGLSELIERTFVSAASLGVSPIMLSQYLQSQAPAYESRLPLVAFVECNRHQTTEFARQISERWRMNVASLLLSDIYESADALPSSCRLVVTTYFHYSELRQLLSARQVVVRAVVLDVMSGLYEGLVQLPKGARIGIVHRFEGVHEVEEEFMVAARARELDLRTFPFHDGDEKGLKRFLKTVEIAVCPDSVRDAVCQLTTNGVPKLLGWKAALHPSELDALRKSVPFLHSW